MSFRIALSLAALAVALPLAGAHAAPQILGVVASNGYATPLTCADGQCSAQFSTFCLQEARHAPPRGTPYTPAPGAEVTVVVETAAGETLRLPAGDALSFSTIIGFTSVKVSLPEEAVARMVREYGVTRVAVEMGKRVSLIPVAQAGDPNPQGDDEVALATGPMRLAAQRLFEEPGTASDAARITNLLINELPAWPADQTTPAEAYWAAGNPAIAAAVPEGLDKAAWIYRSCRISVSSHSTLSLRSCLELNHADLMAVTNHRFWREQGGS